MIISDKNQKKEKENQKVGYLFTAPSARERRKETPRCATPTKAQTARASNHPVTCSDISFPSIRRKSGLR